ncbi:hypothetical protein CNYM01_09746 [Colletotrichum nymphaeae SA-01]|uniref:Uncharacterized protein n=1 Tax=Colletotrichum nymphaeae SA-01 TaxID=1460502 RepID=A0A135URG8_9PEZI|nr:hypothetical protein CNYM01_09746 [Colletotrichum nymphaeae SA-01]
MSSTSATLSADPGEGSDPRSLRSQPGTSQEHNGPLRSGSNFEPINLSRRTKAGSAINQIKRLSRRSRRPPVDPSCEPGSMELQENPQPRGSPAQCQVDEILKLVFPGADSAKKYPEFDAIGFYAKTGDDLECLWRSETERLMNIAQNPNTPIEFLRQENFQGDTEKGYRDVSRQCQKVLTAITICLLDNECINAEHCGQLSNQQRLSDFIKQVSKGQGVAESIGSMGNVEAQQRLEATYALINYISAVLTRLIVQTSPDTSWQKNVLSVLIKRITKIKLLIIDLNVNSTIAVRTAEAVLSNVRESGGMQHAGGDMNEEEECEEYMRMIEANEKEGTTSYEEKQKASHCVKQNKFRFGLNSALKHVLMSMRFINPAFEICAVAYETGFEGFKALLFQDRDLVYSATSDLDNLNTAHSAFNILNQTVVHLTNISREQKKHPGSLGTKLHWTYGGSEDDRCNPTNIDLAGPGQSLELTSMDKVITVMVPLVMTCPSFLENFTNFRHVIALTTFTQDDVQPLKEEQFGAFFRMYTSRLNQKEKPDVLHLSKALRDGFFSRSKLVRSSHSPPKAQQHAKHQLNELNKLTEYMDEWVIDETCVTVPCPGYVWGVIFTAVLFAAGGLGIGFSVGERINGVDPSNLATYLWVVAAFTVLVGKSMKVKEWAWNDFLRRRVRCCSVSELQSVTGIGGQLIIAKLLHDERGGSALNIRGPYNSVFLRRSTEGFSIDKPISSSTLLLSGLTMLKVVTAKGHALVCLDFRRGTDLRVISHMPNPQEEHLICEQVDRLQPGAGGAAEKSQAHVKHALSRSRGLKWKRVQGLYELDAKFV